MIDFLSSSGCWTVTSFAVTFNFVSAMIFFMVFRGCCLIHMKENNENKRKIYYILHHIMLHIYSYHTQEIWRLWIFEEESKHNQLGLEENIWQTKRNEECRQNNFSLMLIYKVSWRINSSGNRIGFRID